MITRREACEEALQAYRDLRARIRESSPSDEDRIEAEFRGWMAHSNPLSVMEFVQAQHDHFDRIEQIEAEIAAEDDES